MPIVAAVQTTPSGLPVVACLRQQPHTEEEVAVFAATHLATSATVVSDGLWCSGLLPPSGRHERIVTGGGKASVKPPQFRAVNTLLGNLKTAITGTYHAFGFAKYAHRYLAEFQYRFNSPIQHEDPLASFACRSNRRPAGVRARAAGC